jgi:hypothetical protein
MNYTSSSSSSTGGSLPKDCLLDRIHAMLHQEDTSYRYELYLPRNENGVDLMDPSHQLNITWREKICQWSYNVVDHFDLPRELVAISLSLFDRFLATRANRCTGNMALLASLTTLHIAIKIHAEKRVKISTLASLSRGQFGAKHIEDMEWQILSALGWKLHPPTLFAFCSHFLLLLPNETSQAVRKELFELAIYMAELSVCDSYFVSFKASTIAFAAILNVVDEMPYSRLPAGTREMFLRELAYRVGLNYASANVMAARERLRAMFTPVVTTAMDAQPMAYHPAHSHHQEQQVSCAPSSRAASPAVDDASMSVANMSVSSTGSVGSAGPRSYYRRSRAGSVDSKGSYRYSPSPVRRLMSSPLVASRALHSSSPMVAGTQ